MVVTMAAALVLAACGDGGDPTTTVSDPGEQTTTTRAATTTTVAETTTTTSTGPTTTGGGEDEDAFVIERPEDRSTVRSSMIVYSGRAVPGSTVSVGPFATKVDAAGKWRIDDVVLRKGPNPMLFRMTTTDGVEVEQRLTVFFEPRTPPPPDIDSPPSQ